jgi:hypothetical protein
MYVVCFVNVRSVYRMYVCSTYAYMRSVRHMYVCSMYVVSIYKECTPYVCMYVCVCVFS